VSATSLLLLSMKPNAVFSNVIVNVGGGGGTTTVRAVEALSEAPCVVVTDAVLSIVPSPPPLLLRSVAVTVWLAVYRHVSPTFRMLSLLPMKSAMRVRSETDGSLTATPVSVMLPVLATSMV
jgi:hypothetical protein